MRKRLKRFCRHILALCALLCLAPHFASAETIAIPVEAGAPLKASAADAAQLLQKMTGQECSVGNEYSGTGIFLSLADAKTAPADAAKLLEGKSREGFLIRSKGDGVLQLASLSEDGLSHGLYFYLEQLGARFFFPSEKWTFLPKLANGNLKIDRVVIPDFRSRDFFGTGGFGPRTPVDNKGEMAARWKSWMQRNRFGEEYYIGGHAGEAFNRDNKETLLAHPEYLAKVNGQHVPWSLGAKLNVGNPDAVKLFVNWAVQKFREARAKDPNYFAVSVETADGPGQCNSEECRAIGNGSTSDMLFYVVNEAAKAIRKEFPDGWVSALAYSDHSSVPSFDLEPNVYVRVIPYAFQTSGLSPAELIQAWGKKVKRMAIYDYWAITDWAQNQPTFNYLHAPAEKLRLWKANNIEGFRVESTYSAGAMGLGWYVASHLMWDVNADEKALIAEFYDKAFGPAQAPMQRMLERWANGYRLESNQLGFAYRDLAEARQLAKNSAAVMARLDDYAGYLHYLRLWYEFQESEVGTKEERRAAAGRLIEHMWNIYDTAMVQPARTTKLILGRYAADPELQKRYDYNKKDAPFWKDVHPLSHDELEALLADGLKKYPVLFQPAYYDLNDLKPFGTGQATGEWVTAPTRLGSAHFAVLHDADSGPVQILSGRGAIKARVTIYRQGDEKNKTQLEPAVSEWQEIPLPAAPGIYHILVNPMGAIGYQLRARPQAFLTALNAVEIRQPQSVTYFYVAPGQKTVALQTLGLNSKFPIEVADGDSKKLPVNDGLLKIIPVPAGQDGKLWALRGHSGARNKPMTFLNGPRVYGFSPAGMLVPSKPVPKETMRDEENEEGAPDVD